MGADNQQERLDSLWIAGFTDGEGCFHVSINRIPKMTLGWQVLPEFRIVQHKKDEELLRKIRDYFDFGSVQQNRKDHTSIRKEFRVRGLKNLRELITFFEKNPLRTTKKKDFEIFSQIITMIENREHL